MTAPLLDRLRSMDPAELRFRAVTIVRTRVDRARTALAPETWRRHQLRLSPDAPAEVRRAVNSGAWTDAHVLLGRHFASRTPRFPLVADRLPFLSSAIRSRFGVDDATARGTRIVEGRYDLLGYRDVPVGPTPDWHRDPVHGRTAPLVFWDRVRYLDPACGDHKITWELNRHQHFLHLGRAHALTADDVFYRTFVAQLTDWIRANPPLMGTNWASMLELAFRCLSWTWALHFFCRCAAREDDSPWLVDLLLALDRQLAHVEQNLSRYFSPNTHLTGEALALYVCGQALPELANARAYARTGRDVLLEEATRQVLADGGHAELSAHYHRYSTDFYLLALAVARATNDPAADTFEHAARRQAGFLRAIATDAGCLPLTGDDDGGQLFPICRRSPADAADTLATAAVLLNDPTLLAGPVPEETWWMCGSTLEIPVVTRPPYQPSSTALEASGYYVSRNQHGDHLLFDAGRHGFLNGGHAHADALALVLSIAGRPLLIDPGTATYTMEPGARDRFRSTAMHNTVIVDGRSQSEPRGPFHWSRRTDARCTTWRPGVAADYVEGRHDGYDPVVHVRGIVALLDQRSWLVLDHVLSPVPFTAEVLWHTHPDWTTESASGNHIHFRTTDGLESSLACSDRIHPHPDPALHLFAPEYGRLVPAPCLASTATATSPRTTCTFIGPGSSHLRVQRLDLVSSPAGHHAAAFRVDTDDVALVVLAAVEYPGGSPAPAAETWGTDAFRTRARVAVMRLHEAGSDELCVVPMNLAPSAYRT